MLLEESKPWTRRPEIDSVELTKSGCNVINKRYKTRIRGDDAVRALYFSTYALYTVLQTKLVFKSKSNRNGDGRPERAEGKTTPIKIKGNMRPDNTGSFLVLGRESKTYAERSLDLFVSRALRGESVFRSSPFTQRIWFPKKTDNMKSVIHGVKTENLNQSQANVVSAMTETDAPIVVVHGKLTLMGSVLESDNVL